MSTQSCRQFSGLRSPRLPHEDSSWVFSVLRGELGHQLEFLELNSLEIAALNVFRLAVDPSQVFRSTQNTQTKAVMPLSQESAAMLEMGGVYMHSKGTDENLQLTSACTFDSVLQQPCAVPKLRLHQQP